MSESPKPPEAAGPRAWPSSTDYSEAIQNPAFAFQDETLRDCRVSLNVIGMPAVWSGGFANVYQLTCPRNGATWAVKCFTRGPTELKERYQAISRQLARANLPFTVEFQYVNEGIRTARGVFPIVKMRWVEGRNLHRFVADFVDQPRMLDQLFRLWIKLGTRLEETGIAHGDLQHGNVLLIPRGDQGEVALRLIDYDGMYVPELAGHASTEVGLAAYQHPSRGRRPIFDAAIDRFSHLVICTAVGAVRYGGRRLWESFDDGENLLFRATDFTAPEQSALVRELATLHDADMRALVGHLVLSARRPHDQTPAVGEWARGREVRPLTRAEQAEFARVLAGQVENPPQATAPVAAMLPTTTTAAPSPATPTSVLPVDEPMPHIVIDVGRTPVRKASRPISGARGVVGRLLDFDRALTRLVGPENPLGLWFARAFIAALVSFVPLAALVALFPPASPTDVDRLVASAPSSALDDQLDDVTMSSDDATAAAEKKAAESPAREPVKPKSTVEATPVAPADAKPPANPPNVAVPMPIVSPAAPGAPRVIARLGRRVYARRNEAFRSAIVRMPYVYVLDGNLSTVELVVFRVPDDYFSADAKDELFEVARISDVGYVGHLVKIDGRLIIPGPKGLQIYSLDDPARPQRIVGVPEAPSLAGVTAMLLHDRTLYCLGQPTLRVFDLKDVTAPRELAKPSIQGHWNGCVIGDHLYLVTSYSRTKDSSIVEVFDVASPESPRMLASEKLTLPDAAFHLLPAGEGRLLATSSGYAQTVDVSNPLRPRPVRSHYSARGRVAVVQRNQEQHFLLTGYEVHRIETGSLERVQDRGHDTWQPSGFPYHGDSDGTFAVVPGDHHLLLLANPGEAQRRENLSRNSPRKSVERPTVVAASLPKIDPVDAPSLKPAKKIDMHPSSLAFLPDRARLLTGGGVANVVKGKADPASVSFHEWDVVRGEKLGPFVGHELPVYAVGVSADGKTIASGQSWHSDYKQPSGVRIWDAANRRERRQMALRSNSFFPHTIAFLGATSRFAVAGHNSSVVQIFDAETGLESPPLDTQNGNVQALAVSADGQRIATANQTGVGASRIAVWSASNGELRKQQAFVADVPKGLGFSSDGTRLACGFFDGSLWDWEWEGNAAPVKRTGCLDQCVGIAFSADARRVVAAGYVPRELPSGKVVKHYVAYVLDWPAGRVLFQLEVPQPLGNSGWYPRVAISADGRATAIPTPDGKTSVWEIP